jgi:hypothetical protein
MEENFNLISKKLSKLYSFFNREDALKEKKVSVLSKLEKLKENYSSLKKVYENYRRQNMKV